MKSELEKMLAGETYDCACKKLMKVAYNGRELAQQYNRLSCSKYKKGQKLLSKLLGALGKNVHIAAPFYVDYGKFIYLGDNVEINLNCTFLDCNKITIGNNVLIGPNVQIYTVFHPLHATERFLENSTWAVNQSAPVTIGNNCWIGGGVIILANVTIGDNVTIGAGSVVTKSIPANTLAFGNPCRVVKELNS